MKQQQELHTNKLEELLSTRADQKISEQLHAAALDNIDAEMSDMVMLARYLQTAPSLKVDPVFAQHLERKVLAHSVRLTQTKVVRRNGHWLFGWAPQMWIAFATILLLCLSIGTGTVLAMAHGAENPDNPLYGLKVWEQQAQLSLASSPQGKVDVSLQIIRDRLKVAASMADPSHASDYQQAIQDANQQMEIASQTINALPAGSDRQRLSSELTTLQTDARQTLYSLLPKLSLTEQLTTTTFLGHLGASVPSIQSATVVVTAQPTEQATITIIGINLTSSTHLVINNQLLAGSCALQQNICVFVIPWHHQKPPSSIAVLNEDDTTAQTTAFTFTNPDTSNNANGNNGDTRDGGNNGNGANSGDGGNNGDGTNSGDGTNGNGNNGHGNDNNGQH